MKIANASMLDEASSAAEAMTFCYRIKGSDGKNKFFVADSVHPSTIDVINTRALPLGIEVEVASIKQFAASSEYFGAILQYPATDGSVEDHAAFAKTVHDAGGLLVVATDLLSLTLLSAPGEWGADVVVGNSQRFGVPLGFGGPHAAFFATSEELKRDIPGRLIGVSKDAAGRLGYRLSLQTREQHIRREKATSNICTAQALLAIVASFYAVYHGPEGIKNIAKRVNQLTALLASLLKSAGVKVVNDKFFDTIKIEVAETSLKDIISRGTASKINFRAFGNTGLGISLDETTTLQDVYDIVTAITGISSEKIKATSNLKDLQSSIPKSLERKTAYLTHPVFNSYHSETELLRYLKRLESKDLSLAVSMIPLGSCTMKLNATAEMIPITWPEFGKIHPFAPLDQAAGYIELITELEQDLCKVTGFAAASLQPNAGSQGEYAGLLCIRAWHLNNGDTTRNVCLIPRSAHGTNPASAAMVGMKVVVVDCDEAGNIDIEDLKKKVELHQANLAALMVTYPSTHGVFEEGITEVCKIIHQAGGQVYMDGANLNAQVGLCQPALIGADVCHINLHKTFCIPHGGGGPGVGPIAVAKHLAPFLPGHSHMPNGSKQANGPVCSAPWGSAGVLPISWAYIRLMGAEGLTSATKYAILNANYLAKRLEASYPVLYKGKNGMVAHECILDVRNLKRTIGIEAQDIAKRLMDYGFHAPTVSFPVVETLMIEPTESESKAELDRFCDTMIMIRKEIDEVEQGKVTVENSVLRNAPHTALEVSGDTWTKSYTRKQAAYPVSWLEDYKFWPAIGRIDGAYGDRNLICSCPSIDSY
jgi:glycine dehydrogenase